MDKKDQMRMAQNVLQPLDDKVNRNAKDSVFVDLFGQRENLLKLYQALHPEDSETDEDDLTIVTLESLLLKDLYNDLGFMAGNRLMVLVEAQSAWSVNIVVRFFLYLADTYKRYIEKNSLNLYTTKKVELPVPELYVIYTGTRKECPEVISLGRDVFGTNESSLEIRATVIRDGKKGDIINQYVKFTRIFDEQVFLHGRTREAVLETIRICRENDVLSDYLEKEEVADIMFTFVDKEKQLNLYVNAEREEGRREGHQEGILDILKSLVNDKILTVEEAAKRAGLSEEAFCKIMNEQN